MNKISRIRQIILVAVLLAANGCHNDDVTYSSRFGKPVGNRCFKLRQDCEIDQGSSGTDFVLYAFKNYRPRAGPIPSSHDGYDFDFTVYRSSALPRGTKIRITKLRHEENIENDNYLAYGVIESGPLAGKTILTYEFVRLNVGTYVVQYDRAPDPDFFEDCTDAPQGASTTGMSLPSSRP